MYETPQQGTKMFQKLVHEAVEAEITVLQISLGYIYMIHMAEPRLA
jgi:hypothetical protein